MTTASKRVRVQTFYPPPLGEASLEELQRRSVALRRAILHERELKNVVDAFHDGFANEDLVHRFSRPTEDPTFHALLGDDCILGLRYRGEVFEKKLFHCPELRLFHGCLLSTRHIGCAFQFEGDTKGVIAVSTLSASAMVDYFRYSIVPANSFSSRGGRA